MPVEFEKARMSEASNLQLLSQMFDPRALGNVEQILRVSEFHWVCTELTNRAVI
jgi:hypothetical protein